MALLSPGEQKVLGLLQAGLAVKEVARKLGRQCSTVYTQRARMRRKLGVRTNKDLARVRMAPHISPSGCSNLSGPK